MPLAAGAGFGGVVVVEGAVGSFEGGTVPTLRDEDDSRGEGDSRDAGRSRGTSDSRAGDAAAILGFDAGVASDGVLSVVGSGVGLAVGDSRVGTTGE